MIRAAVTALLLLLPHGPATAGEITFNGVPLGVTERVFRSTHPDFRCDSAAWTNLMADRICVGAGDAAFAGLPARIYARFFEHRLASVTVYLSAPFEDAVDMLFDAFGKPEPPEHAASNREAVAWKAHGAKLQALRQSSRETELIYRADWLAGKFARRAADQQERWAWLTDANRIHTWPK